ncbi:SOS response-associated peptidase [Maricurvus nonylphenolicus]|uniref:SOS response-associated peptidase n=1 Tax=Maricurvus nonylphenolicus TaxID=1008307 RepID=UPI0036F3A483
MCGRFNIIGGPAINKLMADVMGDAAAPTLATQLNVAPTESVPVVLQNQGNKELHLARWWLTPSWSSGPDTKFSMFNARAEGLESSRAYKGPFHHQRCILPVSSYIEWQKTASGKQPIEIYREDEAIAFAGLWDVWNDELLSCSVVTTAASESMAPIHNRMPVMLDQQGIDLWLDGQSSVEQLQTLFTPNLVYPLMARPVDKAINNARVKELPRAVGEVRELL